MAGQAAGPTVLHLVDCSLLTPPREGPDRRSRYLMLPAGLLSSSGLVSYWWQEDVMSQDAASPGRRLRAPVRRIVVRFADVACPPEVRVGEVRGGLLAEFEALLGALPAVARWLVQGGLFAFDQGARLYPRAHGRRFTRLGDDDADAYFRAIVARPRGGLADAAQRIKGLVVFCYYEQPKVKERVGYRPDDYIAEVSRRRLSRYGAQIHAGEEASLGPDPGGPDAVRPPTARSDGS